MKVLPIRALLSQISEHGFHFALSVQISGAAGGGDAIREHGLGFGDAVGTGERLGGHEIAGSVIGIGFQEDGELGEGAIEVTLLGIFHS